MLKENKELEKMLYIRPNLKEDERGWFNRQIDVRDLFSITKIDNYIVNVNRSFNKAKFTLRGMHMQKYPKQEVKIVSCLAGEIQDIIIDVDPNSPTYLNYVSCILSAVNRCQLIVPFGFAHGYLTLEPNTEVQYFTSEYYSPKHEVVYNSLSKELINLWQQGDYIRSEKDVLANNLIIM